MKMFRCASKGPQNNGKLKKCNFMQEFPAPESADLYNCPICASRLVEASQFDNR
jgi:hypothetical protein